MKENVKKSKKMIILGGMCLAVIVIFLIVGGVYLASGQKSENNKVSVKEIKNPEKYTWEQYQALSQEDQAAFPDYFDSMDEFNEWYNKVVSEREKVEMDLPSVDLHGKNPEDITWEEYQEMSEEEKAVFPDSFDSMEAYETWYKDVKQSEEAEGNKETNMDLPSVDLHGKNPEDITWKEYQAMTEDERAIFPDYFESWDSYKAWHKKNCPDK